MTKARRNLILQSISGNKIVRRNYETSVIIPFRKNKEGYWGGSSKPQNPTSKKESKFKTCIYDKLQTGDVIVFSDKNEVNHAGIVTEKLTDPKKIKQIGWQSVARPYDLAFSIQKLSLHIPNILDYVDYQSIPRDTKIVSKNKDKKFWEEFSDIIEEGGINPPEIIEDDVEDDALVGKVYLYGKVKDERKGPVKIGHASVVERRMDSQDSDYDEIELYYKVDSPNGNGGDLEARIHSKFAKFRRSKMKWSRDRKKRIEWFDVNVITAIDGANIEVEHMRKMYS